MGNILSFMQLVKLKTCGGKGLRGNKFLRSTCSELATNPVYFERAKHTYPLQPNDLCWLHLSITSCCIWRIVTSCSSQEHCLLYQICFSKVMVISVDPFFAILEDVSFRFLNGIMVRVCSANKNRLETLGYFIRILINNFNL